MPDWFYRTVSRRMLFQMRPAAARDFALGVMGTLGRHRLGRLCIDLLGHMRPDPRLRRELLGVAFLSPVGLGCAVDARGVATQALARFGVGYVEVGPIYLARVSAAGAMERRVEQQALWLPDPPGHLGLEAWAAKLAALAPLGVPLAARLACAPGTDPRQATEECRRMIERLAPCADLFVLTTPDLAGAWKAEQWRDHLRAVIEAIQRCEPARALLICLPADLTPADADGLVADSPTCPRVGVLVEAAVRTMTPGRLLGLPAREPALRLVRLLRERRGEKLVLVGGGVHEPAHALELIEAGADLVHLDAGLIYSGPGLPKRVNDALLFRATRAAIPAEPPAASRSWFWTLLLGVSMLFGGTLALGIAATRVVLPYDEAFAGLSREQMAAANPRLLSFLTHDRVSLAGTMLAIGVLYTQLSLYGVRRGLHWARTAILASAFAGFGSFFLFLGFGYFEPFHAFVTAVLFQFLLLALHSPLGERRDVNPPNLREDWRWRCNQWGQFLFVIHGVILIVAGLVICTVGITKVFVPEDLEFMQTTPETLAAHGPHLLPLVAHDRATFGGMLTACGLTTLLAALWGFRQGDAWLWWGLLVGGGAAYAAALGVHLAVGYTNLWHLAPAFGGAALLAVGLALSWPFLCGRSP